MKVTAAKKDQLQREYNSLLPEIEAQERRLPRTANLDDFLRDLNMLGGKNNIRFDTLEGANPEARVGTRGEAEESKGYEKIPIQIKLHVDYHGLGRFINDVENGERFMRVDSFVVNNGGERLSSNRDWSVQNVEMQLSTFRFVEEEKKPATTPTPTPTSKGKGK